MTGSKRQRINEQLDGQLSFRVIDIDSDDDDKPISVVGEKEPTAKFLSAAKPQPEEDYNPYDPPVYCLSEDGSLQASSGCELVTYTADEEQYIRKQEYIREEQEILPFLHAEADKSTNDNEPEIISEEEPIAMEIDSDSLQRHEEFKAEVPMLPEELDEDEPEESYLTGIVENWVNKLNIHSSGEYGGTTV